MAAPVHPGAAFSRPLAALKHPDFIGGCIFWLGADIPRATSRIAAASKWCHQRCSQDEK
jgi:hypothetical protein